jgi:RNA polymerase sigma factor (sigma-70 family)
MKPTNLNFRPISRDQFRPCAHPQSFAEKELLERARAGDQAAFGELCKRSEPRLLRMAQHIVRNEEDAQDAVQEALLNAFRNLSAFDERSSLSTWATRIAINSSLMQLRKRRRFFLRISDDAPEGLPMKDPAPNPEALLAEKDERRLLQPAKRSPIESGNAEKANSPWESSRSAGPVSAFGLDSCATSLNSRTSQA